MATGLTKKKANISGIIFLCGLIAITLFLVIFIIIMIGKPFVIKSYDNMKETSLEEYLHEGTSKHSEYFVFVYDESSAKDNYLKDLVIEYANAARTNGEYLPIFVMNYKDNRGITGKDHLNITSGSEEKDIPALILVKNKTISSSYKTVSNISNALVDAMNK